MKMGTWFVLMVLVLFSVAYSEDSTSVNWTAAPAVAAVEPGAASADPAATLVTASPTFKKAVVKAAEESFRKGDINRWDLAKIRLCPARRLAEAQSCVTDEAVRAGVMKPADVANANFDWSALLAFIEKLLPLILQLISIFGG